MRQLVREGVQDASHRKASRRWKRDGIRRKEMVSGGELLNCRTADAEEPANAHGPDHCCDSPGNGPPFSIQQTVQSNGRCRRRRRLFAILNEEYTAIFMCLAPLVINTTMGRSGQTDGRR